MKKSTLDNLLLVGLCLLITACGTDISEGLDDEADAGDADFTTFVTVGDSLTAGYADGALYRDGQLDSYPAILAQQFALAGGGSFDQPLMPKGATGSMTLSGANLGRPDRLVLGATGDPDNPVSPETIDPTKTIAIDVRLGGAGSYNNMGVPGAKSFHLPAAGYGELTIGAVAGGTANPYFSRFASSDITSVLADAAGQAPSFFILWIGNNDILLYALDGGGTQNAVPPYGLGTNDVTDPAVFTPSYNAAVATLKTANNKGVLVNIPDVATIPYFTTVPYNPIPMTSAQASAANAAYAPYNGGIALAGLSAEELAQRTISFAKGDNALVITDESLTTIPGLPSIRQATSKDYIVLTASPKIGTEETPGDPSTVWGVGKALLDSDVLTEFEYDEVETARAAYNDTIEMAAMADGLALLDVATLLDELNESGLLYGSGGVSAVFGQGGAFSLDGVHPTARGYAVIANEIMKVIENEFGAKLPPVNPSDYTTVFYQ